jgi:hypothetical protein
MKTSTLSLIVLTTTLAACSEEGVGELDVRIYGEAFIEEGIPGDVFVDGWAVDFTKFVIAVDRVGTEQAVDATRRAFDLTIASDGAGHEVGPLEVAEGSQLLQYRVGPGAAAAGGNAATADAAALATANASVLVEGTATKDAQTISFAWTFPSDTTYTACEVVESVPADGSATTVITIHADHLFYDDLESPEPNVAFDLVAASDADGDGTVTKEELQARDITGEARYQVGSRDITNLWDFIDAQTATLGHIDGEGHCET